MGVPSLRIEPTFFSGAGASDPPSHTIPRAEVSFYKLRPKSGLAEIGTTSAGRATVG